MALTIPQPLVFNQQLNMLFLTLNNINNSFNDSYPKIGNNDMQTNNKLGQYFLCPQVNPKVH